MADETKTLAWRLIVETQGIEANTRKAANSLSAMENATQKLAKGLQALGVVASAAAVGKLGIEALKTADAYVAMSNTLKQSTASAEELQAVQQALIAQAADTSGTVEQATASFNKLHDVTEGLGLSQQGLIDLSKTLTETMRLSGMNAEGAQAGIDGFANAIEDGTVSLKEFKTLVQDSPETIKALAEGLGKSKDELRLLAQQGKLTSEMMVQGLGNAASDVDKRFGQMAPTVADALASVKSSFGAMIGELNEGAGITAGIALGLKDLAELFRGMAKNAQMFGIATKLAVSTVAVDIESFLNQLFESFNKLGLRVLQFMSLVTTGGVAFRDTLAKQVQESDARMSAFVSARADTIADLKKQSDDAVAALTSTDLNKPTDIGPKVMTDQQVQAVKSFTDALLVMENRAGDAAEQMRALRIEMKDGKQAADIFRAQVAAANAGRDLKKQMQDTFEQNNITPTTEQLAKLNATIATFTKSTVELKAASNAWGVVGGAINSAMNESERAEKQLDELNKALQQMQKSGPLAASDLALVQRAMENIQKSATATKESLLDSMEAMTRQTAQAGADLAQVVLEMQDGKDAAEAWRASFNAADAKNTLVEQWKKTFSDEGMTLPPELEQQLGDLSDQLHSTTEEAKQLHDAWTQVDGAWRSSLTQSERAQMEIEELGKAFGRLAEKGPLTDEMIEHYQRGVQTIVDGADVIKSAWKDAANAMLNNFVDFMADGEFNFKRFVNSTLQQFARIITQALIVKSLTGTAVGTFLGFANGGALDRGRVVPMAAGGVVSSPTFFPMASGATGLMGEAGPEAVMPLARLSSGKLGVNAAPHNIQVINNTGVQASARIERATNRTQIILEAAQLGAQLAEERMTRSLRSGYGPTSTAMQGTYGLRRRG